MNKDISEKIQTILDENNKTLLAKIEEILAIELKKSNKPDFSKIKPGDNFDYCGFNWTFLGEEQGGALCMTSEPIGKYSFDLNGSNNWTLSSLRKQLNEEFLEQLNNSDLISFELDLVADNGDKSYGKTIQYVGILNAELWRKYSLTILSEKNCYFWTCSPWNCSGSGVRFSNSCRSAGCLDADRVLGVSPICVFRMK